MTRIDELRSTYKRMVDEELLKLAAEMDDLTDDAKTALHAELDSRGIIEHAASTPSAPSRPGAPSGSQQLPSWFMGEKTPALPPNEFVAVYSATNDSEAEEIQATLRDARIESQVEYVILVHQSDSERAFEALSERLDAPEDSDEEHDDEEEDDG